MLNNLRWKLSTMLAKKGAEESSKGNVESILKALKYVKYSIMIAPRDKELVKVAEEFRKTAEKYRN
ncbi:hypothetical protein CIRMBP1271_00449 [Enterococcus cecorum]|uniref:hypothetical protein n=1 Tax=Enterococcus cecorum TaxID=44008 RepID=UPI000658CBFA|nr:hypothetical protein [Enterococcus cecorum]KLO67499.1 hypothetical protein AA985_00945 [Enterococcus cecorum]CAI3252800.1 hypothetical protein CIRMBP1243_00048 [Enterococcus cecorum]CAI3253181.1 hypothetical protein CIRMBP1195_00036 [Enterococcus cecorum]CAI3253392.1 hypothetical protein CIRMBP1217_00035 [Enterococcus cecorum]CAI3254214.1 hypothetical protein CIRMBP1240_00064 [Enterococcus cecorum]